jgi:hypothetical protein
MVGRSLCEFRSQCKMDDGWVIEIGLCWKMSDSQYIVFLIRFSTSLHSFCLSPGPVLHRFTRVYPLLLSTPSIHSFYPLLLSTPSIHSFYPLLLSTPSIHSFYPLLLSTYSRKVFLSSL